MSHDNDLYRGRRPDVVYPALKIVRLSEIDVKKMYPFFLKIALSYNHVYITRSAVSNPHLGCEQRLVLIPSLLSIWVT